MVQFIPTVYLRIALSCLTTYTDSLTEPQNLERLNLERLNLECLNIERLNCERLNLEYNPTSKSLNVVSEHRKFVKLYIYILISYESTTV